MGKHMKRVLITLFVLLVLVGLAFTVFVHYKHKREDAVAYFALNVLHKDADTCYADKSYYQRDCDSIQKNADCIAVQKKYFRQFDDADFASRMGMDCITTAGMEALSCIDDNYRTVRLHDQACDSQANSALQVWSVKYPRQAANLRRDVATAKRKALEDSRKADAKNLDKQRGDR